MGLALAHADRVRSLVLADTLGGIPVEGWWKAALHSRRAKGRSTIPRCRTSSASRNPAARAPLSRDRRAPSRSARRSRPQLIRTLGDVTFDDDAARRARRLPTLFIVGTEDEIFPPAWIADAAARVPGARVETVDGAGHSPYFEQPDAWNSLVTDFWRQSP